MVGQTERYDTISKTTIWDRSVTSILIVGICISIISFFVVRSQEVKSARDEFRLAAASSEFAVRRQIESNLATLRALRAWMVVTPDFRAEDADRYARELIRNNPGVLSLKWVPRGGKLPVVDAPAAHFTLPMYLPVSEGPPGHERLKGYAAGLFQIGDVLERELRPLKPDTIDIGIYDLSAAPGKRFLYGYRRAPGAPVPSAKSEAEALTEGDFSHIVRFDAGGRQWAMVMTATDGLLQAGVAEVALMERIRHVPAAHRNQRGEFPPACKPDAGRGTAALPIAQSRRRRAQDQ
jgi:hypothetical protein